MENSTSLMEEASIDWDFIYFWISCFWNLFIGGGGDNNSARINRVTWGVRFVCFSLSGSGV